MRIITINSCGYNSCRLKNTFANQGKANHPGKFTTCCFFFNQTLPNIRNVFDKNWHILFIHEKLKKPFDKKLFIAYVRNKKLHQIIGGNCILKSKVVHKNDENHVNM